MIHFIFPQQHRIGCFLPEVRYILLRTGTSFCVSAAAGSQRQAVLHVQLVKRRAAGFKILFQRLQIHTFSREWPGTTPDRPVYGALLQKTLPQAPESTRRRSSSIQLCALSGLPWASQQVAWLPSTRPFVSGVFGLVEFRSEFPAPDRAARRKASHWPNAPAACCAARRSSGRFSKVRRPPKRFGVQLLI